MIHARQLCIACLPAAAMLLHESAHLIPHSLAREEGPEWERETGDQGEPAPPLASHAPPDSSVIAALGAGS